MKTPSEVSEDFQIFYSLGRHGWSDLFLFLPSGQFEFRISDIFNDAPRCLLQLCEAILQNLPCRIALIDEPGGCIWEVVPDDQQRHLMTLSVFDVGNLTYFDSSADGELVARVKTKRRYLVSMLISELWKPHNLLKEPSYQKGRGNFPHKELLALNKVWDNSSLGPSFLK